ncbi:DUF4453 domain-containing protein [Tropicimonas sp. IMCC34043]|uniref:DUF4453 domain-containing protein n=1 Tax=Tropicimonas sp. IMCC34043 TaxID=2248760 RepID=UPI000E284053|nr:DUF4453 domain-containing protein [Tropicimonas sp. IMCC34043]
MRRFKLALPVVLSFLAAPAVAEVWEYGEAECNELWFTRNLIMDRAGYCFGSALGQALFDNRDCRGKDVQLSAAQSAQVRKIQALETQIGCKVNTSRRSLDLPFMAELRRLRDMPLPADGGWACIGWQGAAVPLYDGYSAGAQVVGQIRPGDWVGYGYIGDGGRTVVMVRRGGERGNGMLGWMDDSVRASCAEEAG